ncbi:Glucanosyltransferase-domain-containing protein [Bipolaris maydis]|nr:Glucanosyltransferase-domain-containing protein [Bipolaris maydis]
MSASISCPSIRICGRFFWKGDDRFFVRGVAYQLHSTLDPISDDHLGEVREDVFLFKELGLNTLFIYCIDNTKDHTRVMKLLEEAGIYVFMAVSTPLNSINRLAPTKSYNPDTMASFFKTVDTMAKFPNTLGVLAGNELINNDATLPVAAVLKAVVRDLKKHMKLQNEACGQRILPIGYNAATSGARDKEVLEYLTVGEDHISIDFWTCKNYDLKGLSDVTRLEYDDLLHRFTNTCIPIFLSEYGNNSQKPRLFQETTTLYSSAMSRVFSGGCVYEFWQNTNGYGLVEMPKHRGDKQIPAHKQNSESDSLIYERRETDRGVLLILRDFVNYKTRLAEIGDIEVEIDEESTEKKKEKQETGTEAIGGWQANLHVPESCVDWVSIKGSFERMKFLW